MASAVDVRDSVPDVPGDQEVRFEDALVGLALLCALVLLFAPFTGRTVSEEIRPSGALTGSAVRHSAGWDYVAPFCGLLAILVLVLSWYRRPPTGAAAFGAMMATVAFSVAAAAAGGHGLDAVSGRLDLPGYVTRPAPSAFVFAVAGTLGAGWSLALLVGWLPRRQLHRWAPGAVSLTADGQSLRNAHQAPPGSMGTISTRPRTPTSEGNVPP